MIFAFSGITALKVIFAIIAILLSGLCLAFLYMSGEMLKLRSRWLVMGFGAVVLCLVVSLVLKYPAPAVKVAEAPGSDIVAGEDSSNVGSSELDVSFETGVG